VDDYSYDTSGNMLSDSNKKITAITYNHLNLPMKIIFANGGTIEYLYSATGQKVSKVVRENNTLCAGSFCTATTEYLDGFQYKNNVLLFFPQAEGYVNVAVVNTTCVTCKPARIISSTSFNYVYNYTDHLGNVRLSYGTDPATGGLKIMEENHYFPFGMKHEGYNSDQRMLVKAAAIGINQVPLGVTNYFKYKYNGKELQDELGLNFYDYGMRNYDPAIGRWSNIDPLAEKFSNTSGYVYALNNPVYFIDPDGMDVVNSPNFAIEKPDDWITQVVDGKTTHTYVDGITTVEQAKAAGYENVQSVSQSIAVNGSNNAYSYNLNANGSVTDSDSDPVKYTRWNTGNNTESFTTAGGTTIAGTHPSNTTMIANGPFQMASGAANQMDFSSPFFAWGWAAKGLGALWSAAFGNAATKTIAVTEASIAKALEGSVMKTTQAEVSLPMVERYVRMLESGSVSPSIKVADGVIVDGNHRYIAGRLFGTEPTIVPGSLSPSQVSKIVPIQQTKVNPIDWGGY
jgi:RHS repeat-associated protein